MMKKLNKKIFVLMVLVALVASAFLGATYSKYTTVVTGDGDAKIAQWNFKVNGSTEELQTINLATTYDTKTLVNKKIAPGTEGNFDLIIDATDSEVGVKYDIDFQNETNKPTNLKFYCGNQLLKKNENDEYYITGVIDADDTDKTKILTIKWKWDYETQDENGDFDENDKTDTAEGMKALDYTFDVVVKGTQVLPQAKV